MNPHSESHAFFSRLKSNAQLSGVSVYRSKKSMMLFSSELLAFFLTFFIKMSYVMHLNLFSSLYHT